MSEEAEAEVEVVTPPSAAEPSATPESQNTGTSETQTQETTDGDPGGETNDDPEQAEADKALKKGKNWYARRIDQKERELQQEKREKQELLAILRANAGQQQQPQAKVEQEAQPKREDFPDYEGYIEARADYRTAIRTREEVEKFLQAHANAQQQQRIAVEAQQLNAGLQAKIDKAAAKTPDYHEVLASAEDIKFPSHVGLALTQLEDAPAVMYYLGKNHDVMRSLITMSPFAAAAKLGAIEASLKAPAKPSSAPKPGRPVGGKSTAASAEPPMDMDQYHAWRKKQRGS